MTNPYTYREWWFDNVYLPMMRKLIEDMIKKGLLPSVPKELL